MHPNGRRRRVVWGQPGSAEPVEKACSEAGFEMIWADSTLSFLQACRSQSPAALVLDLRLPWHSPALVCRLVRSQPETLRVPLLVVESAEGSGQPCLEAGADELLPPGAGVDQVLSRLRELVPAEPVSQPGGARS